VHNGCTSIRWQLRKQFQKCARDHDRAYVSYLSDLLQQHGIAFASRREFRNEGYDSAVLNRGLISAVFLAANPNPGSDRARTKRAIVGRHNYLFVWARFISNGLKHA
jgi:hypothetical protein